MRSKYVIWFAGGDRRQQYAAARLAQRLEAEVHVLGVLPEHRKVSGVLWCPEGVPAAPCDLLVLPIPASADGETVAAPLGPSPIPLAQLAAGTKSGALVLGGKCSPAVRTWFGTQQVEDYLDREELCLANAVPTAEGAIQTAMEHMPTTLHGGSALVVGYGRIGMALAPRLRALGMEVTVCARRCESRALAEMHGCRAVPPEELGAAAAQCNLVYNTVPALLLEEPVLRRMPPESLIVDLASRPGGTDFAAAQRLGIPALLALALPAKVAPATAGEIIADTICNILKERGFAHERSDR